MWSALHAARPRWLRLPGRSGGQPASEAAPFEAETGAPTTLRRQDVALGITRPDLDRLALALAELLGPELHRPDTPARLEAALAAAVERLGGSGVPHVTRQPAGLTTPESWQVRLDHIEPGVAEAIRRATRTGHFPTVAAP